MKLKYKIASIIMLVSIAILIPLSIMYNYQNHKSIKKQELKIKTLKEYKKSLLFEVITGKRNVSD